MMKGPVTCKWVEKHQIPDWVFYYFKVAETGGADQYLDKSTLLGEEKQVVILIPREYDTVQFPHLQGVERVYLRFGRKGAGE